MNKDDLTALLWDIVLFAQQLRKGVPMCLDALQNKDQIEWTHGIERAARRALAELGQTV